MLSYFRINDPYRLVIIFIVLTLFRLPFLISSSWMTIPELSWMIVGERMNDGALLYVGIWDDIGPFSAITFRTIDFIFGRSQLALQLFGLILFFFQIFYMNYISLKHKMYNENNYLPALFYGILGLTFFNIITLSPQLLGLTFVLLSLNSLFNHIETRSKTDGNLLNIGLYIGIASLFFIPYFIMVLVHILGLLVFTNTAIRRYLLLIYGIIIPFILCWLVYAWFGNTYEFYANYLHSLFSIETDHFITYRSFFIVLGATILFFFLAALKILAGFGFTIFQVRIQKTMFFGALISLFIFMVFSARDGYSLIMFFPWVAFFLSHFFISIRHSVKREISFLFYFISVIVLYFGIAFNAFNLEKIIDFNSLLLKAENSQMDFENKKILVLGPDISPYYSGLQATPYFNWNLSKKHFEHLQFYDNMELIDRNLRSDIPDVIIDQIDLAPELFNSIPILGSEYINIGDGIYERKKLNN